MNLQEALLGGLTLYGLPLLCGVICVACIGIPLPVSLLLIAAGSFVDHGEMNRFWVIVLASVAAIVGDMAGFGIGRWGGRALASRLTRYLGVERRLIEAEEHVRKRGGAGVFFTRWLFTPLGPLVNVVSGFAGYPWPRFVLWDIAGEVLWVMLYVGLGELFSHRVQELSGLLGQITWTLVAVAIASYLVWKLLRHSDSPARIG